ncbi:MAG: YsnF/AvaK domain-containing protein [Pyrinomonadaceae bacterium]
MESTTNNKFIVTGLFKDNRSAECAYDALSERGYGKDDADVMMSDQTRDKYYSGAAADDTELGSKAMEGTGTGAAIGGTLGAIIAGIAAIGTSVLLPGIGLVVAGPLAAALVGAGAGGLAGGLLGALVGSGIPEEHAAAYETGIKSGGIVLRATPRTAEDAAFIEGKFKSCGGEQVYSNASQTTTNTAATARTAANTEQRETETGDVVIPVIEEELQVGKRTVETGGVRVETGIKEQQVEKSVNLREEKINIERNPVDRAVTASDLDKMKDGEIRIPVVEEVPVVAKEARVVEEIVISKDVSERDETIQDTVRRTDVEVEELSADKTKSRGNTNR